MLRLISRKINFHGRFVPSNACRFRCLSSVALQNESELTTEPQYPPVKPRWPPGKWPAKLTEKTAWRFYEQAVKFQDTKILHEKLEALSLSAEEKVHYIITTGNYTPRILDFQKNVTKTALVEGLPQLYENISVDEEFALLKPIILDLLVQEYNSRFRHSRGPIELRSKEQCVGLLGSIINVMYAFLAEKNAHILQSQVDKDSKVECFWRLLHEAEDEFALYGKTSRGHLRYQLKHVADLAVRTEQPLPEFISQDDPLCTTAEVPKFEYNPKSAGYSFRKITPSINAGYRTKNQFWDGNPCEFGLISFHSFNKFNEQTGKLQQQTDRNYITGLGLLSSFGWTVAQAYNQGFDWMNNVTYPFTTQTVVTDGRNMTFFAYQLNTMLLWKDNESNPLRNICWKTPEMKLFESIEGNTVVGFNDDAFKTLIKMFKNSPVDRGVDLRPYLSKDYEPLKATPYMNLKGEPVIERPHPPRIFAKSKKQREISPIETTQTVIQKKWVKSNRHWNEKTGRFDIVERK